jgi:hypothetical protein
MKVFYVRSERIEPPPESAFAFVVAKDADEAVLLLRKDINFTGYTLPPLEMRMCEISAAEVRRAFGDTAATEKGVYGFTTTDPLAAET